jgi:hypothetical protein
MPKSLNNPAMHPSFRPIKTTVVMTMAIKISIAFKLIIYRDRNAGKSAKV